MERRDCLPSAVPYGALTPDYECASKITGLEEALGEDYFRELFNTFLVASIVPWNTDLRILAMN